MLIDSVVWAQYVNVTDTQTATSPQQMLCQRTAFGRQEGWQGEEWGWSGRGDGPTEFPLAVANQEMPSNAMCLASVRVSNLEPFSCFYTAKSREWQTDAGIISCNNPHLMYLMRPKTQILKNWDYKKLSCGWHASRTLVYVVFPTLRPASSDLLARSHSPEGSSCILPYVRTSLPTSLPFDALEISGSYLVWEN